MAACIRRPRRIFAPEELHALTQPVLVVCGEEDDMTGSAAPLARAFGEAKTVIVPKRNHHSTVGDRLFKEAAMAFLAS